MNRVTVTEVLIINIDKCIGCPHEDYKENKCKFYITDTEGRYKPELCKVEKVSIRTEEVEKKE